MYRQNIVSLYESVLINEMDQTVIDYLDENARELLPFDNIFGDKLRIVIPLGSDEVASELMSDLRSIRDFYKVDTDSGDVVRMVKIDPKFGQGSQKEQKIKLGSAINALKIPDDKKKKYLNWYARYKDNLESALEAGKYAIILSRAPIDVVRMSDHENISSCHSRGGSYFDCAVQEAISGGAIAYLVKKDSLDDFQETDQDFQSDDLFKDRDRGISGMAPPLARLRIRALDINTDDGKFTRALPDDNIYGDQTIPGFYKAVADFIRSKQPMDEKEVYNALSDDNLKTPLLGRGRTRGGTYMDSNVFGLLDNYFETSHPTSDVRFGELRYDRILHNPEDRKQEKVGDKAINFDPKEEMENELRDIRRDYNDLRNSSVVNVGYDVDSNDDNEPYFTYSGGVTFDFSDYEVSDEFDFEYDSYNISKEIRNQGQYADLFKKLQELPLNLYINSLYADDDSLRFDLQLNSDDGGIGYDTSDFSSFCFDLDHIRKIYGDLYEMIVDILKSTGFITVPEESDMSEGDYVEVGAMKPTELGKLRTIAKVMKTHGKWIWVNTNPLNSSQYQWVKIEANKVHKITDEDIEESPILYFSGSRNPIRAIGIWGADVVIQVIQDGHISSVNFWNLRKEPLQESVKNNTFDYLLSRIK